MKKTIFCCLCTFYSFLQAQAPVWMEGKWEGEGNQPEAENYNIWQVEFTCTISQGIGLYQVNYPSFPCGGKWVLDTYDQGKAVFTEQLSYGQDKCMDGGKVVVYHLDNNYLRFIYYDTDHTEHIIAKAVVKKVIDH